ncbi:MAG: hypothetical protein BAJALOKI2v1_270008 [Promethearchaeota archaeon]|nr:MAG: hypothetical protein BAJALOKI2v1_270008 [Candidatus Lokiarchaeota archaeon]
MRTKNEKRTKFIKVMLTEEEFRDINQFSHLEFQNKSEFIRTSIKNRIKQIKDQFLKQKEDGTKDGSLRKKISNVMSKLFDKEEDKEYPINLNKQKSSLQYKMLDKRKKELEKELEQIRKLTKS